MFKVAIIGGENLGNYKLFAEKCIYFLKNKTKNGITILSNGDKYVNVFAKATNIDVKQYNTEWNRYGKTALKNRNVKIIDECDAIIVFDDGTKDTRCFLQMAQESEKPIRFVQDI